MARPPAVVGMPVRRRLGAPVVLLLLALIGCARVTVDTGAAPSDQVLERCCAAAFLGGLVPPKAVHTDVACPQGVARIETSRSFSNLIFTVLTVGLYSPMSLRITCAAAATGASAVPGAAPPPAAGSDSGGSTAP